MELFNEDVTTAPETCESIVKSHVAGLSTARQNKAIISPLLLQTIRSILEDPEAQDIGDPQLRFWARNRFYLEGETVRFDGLCVVARDLIHLHLRNAHLKTDHGDCDKTWAEINSSCAYIPKAVVVGFVKACPVCAARPRKKRGLRHPISPLAARHRKRRGSMHARGLRLATPLSARRSLAPGPATPLSARRKLGPATPVSARATPVPARRILRLATPLPSARLRHVRRYAVPPSGTPDVATRSSPPPPSDSDTDDMNLFAALSPPPSPSPERPPPYGREPNRYAGRLGPPPSYSALMNESELGL